MLDFRTPCTLNLDQALTVPAGDDVRLSGNGHAVRINGGSVSYQPLFVITRVAIVGDALRLAVASHAFDRIFTSHFYGHLPAAERWAFLASRWPAN